MSDYEYSLISKPAALVQDRLDGKLVQDYREMVCEWNSERSLVRPLWTTSQGAWVDSEPRDGPAANIFVGLQETEGNPWGLRRANRHRPRN